jgi:uncharacterized repeat protein (TIGR01451 family)
MTTLRKRLSLAIVALVSAHAMLPATRTIAAPATQAGAAIDFLVSKSLFFNTGALLAPGRIAQYSINIGVNGTQPDPPYTVTITERVPLNMQFATASSTPGWSCADGSGPGTVCTLELSNQTFGAFTFGLTTTLPASVASRFVTNTVSIASNRADPNPSNNVFTTTNEIDVRQVAIAQTGGLVLDANGNSLADPNDEMAYTFAVTNTGLVALSAIRLSAPVYAGNCGFGAVTGVDVITPTVTTTLGSIDFSGPGFSSVCPSAFAANFGTLGIGQSARVTYRARPSAQRTPQSSWAVNQAVVEQQVNQFTYFEQLAFSEQVTTPLSVQADLVVTSPFLYFDPTTGALRFEVGYFNGGAGAADGSVITVPFPPYATPILTASTSGWNCAATQCAIGLGTLSPGTNGGVTLVLSPTAALPAVVNTIELTATISHNGTPAPEGLPSNNFVTVNTLFGTPPAYTATLSYGLAFDQRSDAKIEPGDIVSFTAVFTNSSANRTGKNVQLIVNNNAACCDGGILAVLANTVVTSKGSVQQSSSPVIITLPTLAPGESVVVRFNASATSLPSQLIGKHLTTAQVSDSYTQNFSSGTALATQSIPAFYARTATLSKRVETARPDGFVTLNERVTFTLAVTHTGVEAFPELYLDDFNPTCLEVLTPTVVTSFGSVVPPTGYYFSSNGFRVALPNFMPGQTAIIRANAIVTYAFGSCFYNIYNIPEARNTASLLVPGANQYLAEERVAESQTTINPIRTERMITESQTLVTTNGQPSVAPGERITFTVAVTNVGTTQLRDVSILNSNYTCMTIVPGSATSSVGTVSELAGSPPALVASVGSLAIDQTVQVRFAAIVSSDAQCTMISNMPTFNALFPPEIGGSNNSAPIGNPISMTRSIAAFQPMPVPTAQPTTPPGSNSRRLLLPIVRR